MKKSLFAIALLTIISCQNNIEQYRAGIEELGTKWDVTATSVTNLSEMLNTESSAFTSMMSNMNVNEEMLSKLSTEEQEKINAAMESYTSAGSGFGEMQATLEAFTTEWTTKAAEVTNLKEGLAAGKLEGDVTTKLADLTTFITDTDTKVSEWTEKLEATKTAIATTQSNYTSVVAQLMPQDN